MMILTLSDLRLEFHVLGATCVYQAFLLLVLTYNFGLRQLVVLLQAFLTRRSVKATVAETPYRIQASNSAPEEENEDVDHDGGGDDLDDDGVDDDANYDAHQHWGSAHSGRQTATGAGATAGILTGCGEGTTAGKWMDTGYWWIASIFSCGKKSKQFPHSSATYQSLLPDHEGSTAQKFIGI